MVHVSAWNLRIGFHRHQRLPASRARSPHPLDRDLWFLACDGMPLVLGWRGEGLVGVRLHVLLCAIFVGGVDEDNELIASLARTGCFLSEARRIDTASRVKQVVLKIIISVFLDDFWQSYLVFLVYV